MSEDSDLYKEIMEYVSSRLERQKEWQGKADDPDNPTDRRKIYAKLAEDEAANSKRVANMLVILVDINKVLDQKFIDTEKDKSLYIHWLQINRVKEAAEVLDRVALTMEDVVKELDKTQLTRNGGAHSTTPGR